jgi:anti-sigma B factor antagonist
MKIEAKETGGVLALRILDARFGADAVESFLQQVMARIQQGVPVIVLDLTPVGFIDSSGLGAIVTCLKAQGTRGKMAICGVRESVASLFKLTRMDKVVTLYATAEEAVTALAPERALPDRHGA